MVVFTNIEPHIETVRLVTLVATIKIDISKLQQALRSFESAVPQAISDALDEMAESAVQGAQANAPVDTGELRDSITVGAKDNNSIEVGAGAEHAPYVEFGTSTQPPQPYLEPEANRMESEASRILSQALTRHLRL